MYLNELELNAIERKHLRKIIMKINNGQDELFVKIYGNMQRAIVYGRKNVPSPDWWPPFGNGFWFHRICLPAGKTADVL